MSSRYFNEVFQKEVEVASEAHGRVNLIGEHTDYNGGFVLPTTIPQKTRAFFARRNDNQVRFMSANTIPGLAPSEESAPSYKLGEETADDHWTDYGKGVTWLLRKEGFKISGFDCFISSDVPMGSGLSSSAALEISLFKGLNQMFQLGIDEVTMARFGQRVENEFVGARVGIMDQMVCAIGRMNEALFIDTRDLSFRRLPLDMNEIELLVINSGVTHSNSSGSYNQRRSECEKACELLGVKELRDVTVMDLPKINQLPEPFRKRARHVVTENDRVLKAVEALEKKDYRTLGHLFTESHISMRDDYEISVPELNFLVSSAEQQDSVYGARLTGAGFGGSIVALVQQGMAAPVARQVLKEYSENFKARAAVLVPDLSAEVISALNESASFQAEV